MRRHHSASSISARATWFVVVLLLSSVGVVAGSQGRSDAACDLQPYAPYTPYAYYATSDPVDGGVVGQEYVATADACNNDTYYQGQFHRSQGTADCVLVRYDTQANTHYSNSSCSTTWMTDDTIVSANYQAALWFCVPAFSPPYLPYCWSGPYTNRGI